MQMRSMSFADPVVQRLVAQVQQEYVALYGNPDETALTAEMFARPSGDFLVVLDSEPVAMAGWRLRPDVAALDGSRIGEIKRMYVVRAGRRRGYARAVLAALETSAAAAGVDVLVLESGAKQPEAIALYESAGYVPVPGYGLYRHAPDVRYLGKRLDTGSPG